MLSVCRTKCPSSASYYRTVLFEALYLEAVPSHALAVLANEVSAFLLGIIRGGEQHALVAFRFLF
jgi:hypothetical protein